MNETVRALLTEILDEGLDDWVTLGHVVHRAAVLSRGTAAESRRVALTAVRTLLARRLAVAGTIGDSGFEAWALEPEDAFARIISECENRGWTLGLTDVWLANTDEGDRVARSMKAEGAVIPHRLIR
ncbi:hypothetical protein ACQPZZ_25980 [Microbispora sp. CA-135349]|uniref:hypothetical protein n=1 Tax=Microbispora sp. CA-135349 TaxID=3239953 RepID=UPI003D8EB66A